MLTTLYKKDWKAHWKLLVAILMIMTMYLVIIIDMYDPDGSDLVQSLVSIKFSRDLLSALGMKNIDPSLQSFLASYLYGFLFLLVPMVCILATGNRLVAHLVDRGSMASILSSAVTRRQVALTQALFHITLILLLSAYPAALGLVYTHARFPGVMDNAAFLKMNGGLFLMLLATGGVMFFASCLFNESRHALALGAGLPVLMLALQMLVNYNDKLSALKWLTLFSLYQPASIAAGKPMIANTLALTGVSLALYAGGILVFDKKDLPL